MLAESWRLKKSCSHVDSFPVLVINLIILFIAYLRYCIFLRKNKFYKDLCPLVIIAAPLPLGTVPDFRYVTFALKHTLFYLFECYSARITSTPAHNPSFKRAIIQNKWSLSIIRVLCMWVHTYTSRQICRIFGYLTVLNAERKGITE